MTRWMMAFSLAIALVTTASAQTTQKKFMAGPVTIEDQGSFFVGGVTKVSDYATVPFAPPGQQAGTPTPQQITIGQMYVQFQIPARKVGPGWPVIMVHGSTHTGAALESTPDGREGWYPVLRSQRDFHLRRRSVGARPLRIRPVRAARGRGEDGCRRRQGRRRADPELRPHHRQRRLDGMVRTPPASRVERDQREADPSRRSGRSAAGHREGAARGAALPDGRGRASTTSSSCRTPR